MKLKSKLLLLTVFFAVVIPLVFIPENANAAPSYKGDGATHDNTTTGWKLPTVGAHVQCLECHGSGVNQYTCGGYCLAPDKSSYLMTGHKNMLRKVSPGAPWAGADGTVYGTTDAGPPYYGTDVYNWTNGTVDVGGTGTNIQPIYYIFGAWMDPTQLNTAFDGGFTGEIPGDSPPNDYFCARCHTSGYRFDATGPEPTDYLGTPITDAQFSRFPNDFTSGTSSWYLNGIECERCHRDVANEAGGHNCYIGGAYNSTYTSYDACSTAGGIWTVVKPTSEAETALCIECHRQENPDPIANTISLTTDLAVSGNSCSDGTSPDYPTCVNAGGTWTAPFFDTEPGQTFLNSPHARFTGALTQATQNSPDLSVSMTGSYNSAFKNSNVGDPDFGKNRGCGGCHDVHQSTVEAVNAPKPIKTECSDCHEAGALSDPNAPQINLFLINHLAGIGTPLENMATEPAKPCIICHMQSGAGTPAYHLMRISVDPSYKTFPAATQPQPQIGNTVSDGKIAAVWSDLDLACGQCHGGGDNSTSNPPTSGVPYYSKTDLAAVAQGMHSSAGVNYPVNFSFTSINGLSVSVSATVNCGGTCPTLTYDWNWSDNTPDTSGPSSTASHPYAAAGTYKVKLTVSLASNGLKVGSYIQTVTLTAPAVPLAAGATCTWNANTWSMHLVDTTTGGKQPLTSLTVNWGDNTKSYGTAAGQTFDHTYAMPGTFTVVDTAIDSNFTSNSFTCTAGGSYTAAYFTIGGTVKNKGNSVTLAYASVKLYTAGGTYVGSITTGLLGTFSFGSLKPGNYNLYVTRPGYTFNSPAQTGGSISVGGNSLTNIIHSLQ